MTSTTPVETVEDYIDSILEEKELGDNLIDYVEVLPDDEGDSPELVLVANVNVPLVDTETMEPDACTRTEEMFRNVYGADDVYFGDDFVRLEWAMPVPPTTPVGEVAILFYEVQPGIVELHNAQNGGFGTRTLSQRLHDAIVRGITTR